MRNMDKKIIGLTREEVLASREKYGKNILEEVKKETIFHKILCVFKEPMFLLLAVSAVIYFLFGELQDGIIMLISVVFVCGIEIFQELKTDKALEALKSMISKNNKVLRDGKTIEVESAEIVVGDIVILEEGDAITADGIILECHDLGIDESSLTGESMVVFKSIENDQTNKFKTNMCYSGTNVTGGSGSIRITAVGANTEYGKIGKDLNAIKTEKTPLEKQINKLIRVCAIISLFFCFSVFAITFIQNSNHAVSMIDRVVNSILSGITVAMATIPEELPVVLTVFLAMGAWSLGKKKALVRNMPAVETLGSVSVLCVDKTGTLTKNEMEIKDTWYLKEEDLLFYSTLACETNPYDPMEKAILNYTFKKGINPEVFEQNFMGEYPFNTIDKMMGHIWKIDGKDTLCVKGASESVLPLCHLSKKEADNIEKILDSYYQKGYRVIAVAKTVISVKKENITDYDLEFVGLLGFMDPPKDGVIEAIKSTQEAKIRLIMITGDNGKTAKSIAKQIGIIHNENVITGIELESMSDEELKESLKTTNIFARVYPTHKMRIVKLLQESGEVVAMTGDGINDAPALKKADIGIAMGLRGTEVAKSAADMILLDDNFTTIVESIKNGRRIYDNIRKAICYIFVIHVPIALLSLVIPFFNLPILLLPIHVVLLEFVIDPTASIVFERLKASANIMKEHPRNKFETIITKPMVIQSIVQGFVIFIGVFITYTSMLNKGISWNNASTFSLLVLILSNILLVFVLKSNDSMIKNMFSILKDKVILIINLVILAILLLLIYVPFLNHYLGFQALPFQELIFAFLLSFFLTVWFDFIKVIRKKAR